MSKYSMIMPYTLPPTAAIEDVEAGAIVPDGFKRPPRVAIILPGPQYSQMLAEQHARSFEYILLRNTGYNMFDPIKFDADTYVEEAIAYCREKRVDAVTAFDCFPTFLASAVRQELGLPGPSFAATMLCCNKYYMRKALTPDCQPYPAGAPPPTYPAVVKVSDTQFYSAVRIVQNEAEWRAAMDALGAMLATGLEARKKFYVKWAQRFGIPEFANTAWQDVVLIHTEPYLHNQYECQVEVVVTQSGDVLIADTGDVVHMEGGDNITMFKTPANMAMTPKFVAWLNRIVSGLVSRGYKGIAMDVEFMRCKGEEEAYELNEINSRYSYMGDFRQFVEKDGVRAFVRTFLTSALKALVPSDKMAAATDSGAAAAEALFAALDSDGDRSMTRDELKAALTRLKLKCDDDNLDEVFRALDSNGDGTVDASELSEALSEAVEALKRKPCEIRNLLNRTRLSLGAPPATLPCRDSAGKSKIAAAVFTKRLGPIEGILDQAALDSYLADGTFDTWCPEPPVTNGTIVEGDQIYGGYARMGYLLMTWENDLAMINERLMKVVRDLHVQKDGGWVPCQLLTTTSVARELRPTFDLLLNAAKPSSHRASGVAKSSNAAYLEMHGVQAAIQAALAKVLRERPDDPVGAISAYLAANK